MSTLRAARRLLKNWIMSYSEEIAQRVDEPLEEIRYTVGAQ